MPERSLKPGWTWVRFGDVVKLNKVRCANPAAEGIERYVGLEHIEPEDLRLRSWGLVADGITFTNYFKPGQVLFGKRRAYQRKVAIADFEGVCSSDIYVFETKASKLLLPELLPFICQTNSFLEHAVGTSAGSLSPRTNWKQLADYKFKLPSLDEQKQLESLLQGLEKALWSIQNLVTQLDSLRKAYIVENFTALSDNSDISTVKVSDAGKVQMGRQRSPKYDLGIAPTPYLRVANIYDGYVDTADVKSMDFVGKEFEQYRLHSGDVLLVEGHSSAEVVGRSTIYQNEVPNSCFQNTLIRFRPYEVSSEFSHQYFRFCLYTGRFLRVAKQTTIAHLGASRFASMQFPIPTAFQERKIVNETRLIEDDLHIAQARRDKILELKRNIFNRVFE